MICMKKVWFVVIAGVLLVGLVLIIFLLLHGYHYVNSSLISKYPALVYGARPVLMDGTMYPNISAPITINGKTISYDFQKHQFYCNGGVRNLITYSSENAGAGTVGGWGNTYVIDCGDSYWIYRSSDANPFSLSGPFLFNETADLLKQQAQAFNACRQNISIPVGDPTYFFAVSRCVSY